MITTVLFDYAPVSSQNEGRLSTSIRYKVHDLPKITSTPLFPIGREMIGTEMSHHIIESFTNVALKTNYLNRNTRH